MDLIYSPFFPVPWIILVTAGVLTFVLYFERSTLSRWFLGVLVVLLGLLAFKPALITQTSETPSEPIKVIFENNANQVRRGIQAEARDVAERLSGQLPGADVDVVPLDDRWDRPPVFRDYHRLSERGSSNASLRVLVGSGRHTRPGIGPDLSTGPSLNRAHLVVTSGDTSTPAMRSVKPVIQRSSPGGSTWRFNLTNADELRSPVLRIREGQQVIRRRSIGEADNITVTVETPERRQGQYYFVAELLAEGDNGFPVGHPRRTGLGLSISEDRRRVLLDTSRPGWSSGWWGRQINEFGEWESDYHYRDYSGEGRVGEAKTPDVVLFEGFPDSAESMEQFRSTVEESSRLLWIPGDPPTGSRWLKPALDLVGARMDGAPVIRQGQFQPTLTDGAGKFFPSLARYDYVMASSPPLSRIVANVVPNGSYQTVLEAGSSPLLAIDEDQGIGLLLSPEFHRWAMTWGRLGRPEIGGEFAREIIGKLMRMNDRGDRRLEARRTRAGEPVAVRGGSDTAELVVRSEQRESVDYTYDNSQLTFSRPGRYSVTRSERDWSESIIVIEPDEERSPDGGLVVRDLATGETTFKTTSQLVSWAEQFWEDQSREQRQRVLGWNHFVVLCLLVGLLAGTWISRDMGGRFW